MRPNNDQAEYWNGPEAEHWLVHEHRYEPMLAPFTGLVLDAAAVAPTDRVLDIGCGTGSTTCTAARVADGSQVLGVDISAPLLRRAEQRARQDGLSNVRFEHADGQTHRLAPGSLEVAISRFGMMFFSDPLPRSRLAIASAWPRRWTLRHSSTSLSSRSPNRCGWAATLPTPSSS